MRRKPRSIRSKIILALAVPVVALTGLWAFDVNAAIGEASALRESYNTRDNVSVPCDRLVAALQTERTASAWVLAGGSPSSTTLRTARAATDEAIATFRELSRRFRGSGISADITRARIADLDKAVGSVAAVRVQVDTRYFNRTAVVSSYTSVIGYAFSVSSAAAAASDPVVERIMRTSVGLRRAGELLQQEDALVTAATTAGRLDASEHRQLTEIVGALRFQIPTAGSTLPAPDQAAFKTMLSSRTFAGLRAVEDGILRDGDAGRPLAATREVWKAAFDPAVMQFYGFLANGYDKAAEFAQVERDRILVRFGTSGVLGLLAIVAALVLSVRLGGSAVRRLAVLRTAAIDLAHHRLPEMIARLRAGERIDADDDGLGRSLGDGSPGGPSRRGDPMGDDEIADVGAALNEVQRSAVAAAAGEAALRQDINRVLVNIARRNQSLIDRQLAALRRTGDAEASVFRAEQLAVQMRRHAEHLVILSGSARSRRGRGPEPLPALVNRVATEVEHAERVEIGDIADVEVPEPAVADLGHVLVELLENGTGFSPPGTPVRVSARPVPGGVVVEVEDRGLGMSASVLDETNRRLAQPGEFDPATSARLGLFVVAVLAGQRGIAVELRPSAVQGITAVVTLPEELAVPMSPPTTAGPRRTDATRLVGMTGRARRD
ncbi:sensor histidine kinase [Actinoplanes solisilvae]|uniref:sensor histidine kinase n=1 Tax=Actinoplanes solisilvae TaxID=2486853 RepID=UPI000FD9768A|nr:nitrate- and nitrite sensing domain-containing protein [Actinoplanes solisilvae]